MTDLAEAIRELVREEIRRELALHRAAPERLLSVKEMCAATGLSRTSLHLACRRGDIRPIRVGRRVLYPESLVAELAQGAHP